MNTDEARERVVKDYMNSMEIERKQDLFADHVTKEMKETYFNKRMALIEDIKLGKCDGNFTVYQRMQYYITGEMKPLFTNSLQ